MKQKSYMTIDGQFGNTGKGLLNGYLANLHNPDTVVVNFGPNAGHTVEFNGNRVVTCQLPTAAVFPSVEKVMIGPGSIIDIDKLKTEICDYQQFLLGKQILIHPNACIVKAFHKKKERNLVDCISSTCKGTGAAQADKIMRDGGAIMGPIEERLSDHLDFKDPQIRIVSHTEWLQLIYEAHTLQIESAQGFELSVDGPFYPYCTSRPINTWQVMSDCGLPYGMRPEVYVTMRTYPIRMGHSYNSKGKKVGDSGPVYPDQKEISFEDLGVEVERTTVTQKIRRIFTWSWMNFERMMILLNPDHMFLNFVNYLEPDPQFGAGFTGGMVKDIEERYMEICRKWNRPWNSQFVKLIGTGPDIVDVKQRPYTTRIGSEVDG